MRPFVLEREDTSFYRVRNLLAQYLTSPAVTGYLDGLRDSYRGKGIPFQVEVASKAGVSVLNSESAVLKWLNAFEYHQDPDKQTELRAMYEVFPEPSARALFLYTLLQSAAAVARIGAMIDGWAKSDGSQTGSA